MRWTIACLFAAIPLAAGAEEFGTVTVDLGEGDKTYYTITAESDGETAATSEMRKAGMFTSLSIQAHPEPRFTATDVISVDLTWMGEYAPGKAPNAVDMIHMPDGMNGGIWTSENVPEPLTADLDIDAEGGTVSGTFSGMLCYQESMAADVDTDTCKEVSGTVDTGMLVVE